MFVVIGIVGEEGLNVSVLPARHQKTVSPILVGALPALKRMRCSDARTFAANRRAAARDAREPRSNSPGRGRFLGLFFAGVVGLGYWLNIIGLLFASRIDTHRCGREPCRQLAGYGVRLQFLSGHPVEEVIEVDTLAAFHPAAFAVDFRVGLDGLDNDSGIHIRRLRRAQ
jgi:hypothetical protein